MQGDQCIRCAYFLKDDKGTPICAAFPYGIPGDIISGIFFHNKDHPDQVVPGIHFKPIRESAYD